MSTVGIRALKQNASAVVATAAQGETVVITDRGRPVAQLTALRTSAVERLLESGRARPARRSLADLEPGPALPVSEELSVMRDAERY